MSGEFEAAGAMATAGLAAGAIEGGEPGKAGQGPCANCGAELSGRFCAQCGQPAHVTRSLWHLMEEVLHGLFSFDTKTWRTVPQLIWRPGTLTRNYVYGKRARYVSPLALFLLCVFFLFLVFSLVKPPHTVHLDGRDRAEVTRDLAEAQRDLVKAQGERAQSLAHPDADMPAGLEDRLAQQEITQAQAEVTRQQQALARIDARAAARASAAPSAVTSVAPSAAPSAVTSVDTTINGVHVGATTGTSGVAVTSSEPAEEGQTWQQQLAHAAERPDFVKIPNMPALSEHVRQKLLNPDLTLYQIEDAASKFSFLLVPLSLPFMAILFIWKRRLTFYDHVVFLLYGLSFASLVFAAVLLTAQNHWTQWAAPFLLGLGIPVHMFFHLKGAYALGWWSALWREAFLLVFAIIVLTLYIAIIVVLGLTE